MRKVWNRQAAPLLLLGLVLVLTLLGSRREALINNNGTSIMSSLSISSTKSLKAHSVNRQDYYSFPKWDSPQGITIDDFLAFSLAAARKFASTVNSTKTRQRFPEILYVMDHEGIWVSFQIRLRTWKVMIQPRVYPTEWLMREGWRLMYKEHKALGRRSARSKWPRVSKALYEGDGVPFLVWYGDYKSCNYQNWGNRSIPLFTPAVPLDCAHGFPMPNYKSFVTSKESSNDWEPVMQQYRATYPWENKIYKAVWRGSLSDDNEGLQSVRWRLCKLATESNATTLDVGLVAIPSRHDHLDLDWQSVGGKASAIPQEDFQNYRAVIDVDGNSWSSRMGELLCYNSVLLKVEPQFVEYFYKDLEPWEHYIPVKYDLSDLLEKVDFVLDATNEENVQRIVAGANEWCATHLVKRELGKDFLDVLEAYVSHLERGNSQWNTRWSQYKQSIFTHEAFDMRRIQ